jgi:hypothetical protein
MQPEHSESNAAFAAAWQPSQRYPDPAVQILDQSFAKNGYHVPELLKQIAHAATDLLDCERASIFVHDRATGELCTTVALQSEVIRVPSTSGIA